MVLIHREELHYILDIYTIEMHPRLFIRFKGTRTKWDLEKIKLQIQLLTGIEED